MAKKKIVKVHSLGQLYNLAKAIPDYKKLLILGSKNLGGPSGDDIDQHYRWLVTNANETDSEKGVVAEVNACRDMV